MWLRFRQTRLADAPVSAEGEVPYLADVSQLSRRGLTFAPLVRKTYVELPQPSLANNVSDLQRLEQALGRTVPGPFQMGLAVTRRLPHLLRKADWKVTAVTGCRGPLTEIIDVETGDTSRRNMCIAADIGTTTVVCHLVDLRDGQTLGQAAKYNSQAAFGADVIHRIIHASRSGEGEAALRHAVVGDLNELIHQLLTKYRLGAQDITLLTAAGNTTMIHLLLGLPAENIRKEPYIGATYMLPPFRAAEIGLQINTRGLLYCLPCVAGFVGGDIAAGIAATGMTHGKSIRMLIDIGTNGEIAVGNEEFLVCASASAGPAFEGAECRSGMRATRGAIDHIRLLDADRVLSYSTIGSAGPVGLCGTGYVDLIAEMLRVGLIDKTGRLREGAGPRVRLGEDGMLEYVAVPAAQAGDGRDVAISQGDINNILRAKGAIYAAATVLLNALNLKFSDLSKILVAGAFGNFLNLENAIFIGLLPEVPSDRLSFVGNTSLAGAKLAALSRRFHDDIFRIAAGATYFELSTAPTFMEQFTSACFFPHTNVELFPSVMAELSCGRET
ncbi:MAG: DUF4445 domain-containing protein [Planctomycetes bacterium]|nr:DUF4445 domain-containing protein [Planctomycetota bacterium]